MTPSPARGIDATGAEVTLPVAKEDLTVVDGVGVPRKLIAGQPVPRDLLEAYQKEIGEEPSSEEASGDSDLTDLSRADLNERAAELGVEEPEKLPNKDAVIEAIAEAANDAGEGGGS